ncbi:MAG: DNA-binding protein [Pseudomonadota bacterium]|nr:DNA-binding protein [Pseudomonadota bacterium]
MTGPKFPPLDQETRTHVNTACAAYHLGRRPQTMRVWACHESGPLRPTRINGRLAWEVAAMVKLLFGEKP